MVKTIETPGLSMSLSKSHANATAGDAGAMADAMAKAQAIHTPGLDKTSVMTKSNVQATAGDTEDGGTNATGSGEATAIINW
jgi:hypothetical protein